MEQVRIGVIGAGRMGRNHSRVYSGMRFVDLIGIHDLHPEVGEEAADLYQTEHYADLDRLLGQLDAVSIATPTPTHFDLATLCIERGIHLLIEKPIASTLEQAEILADMAESRSLIVQAGHIERFNQAYRELKNVVQDLKVLAITLRRLSAYEGSNLDVDVVLDLMVHDADLALDLLGGPPDGISAHGLSALSESIDHVVAQLRYEDGPLVSLTASRVTEQKIRSIEVTTLEAYLECDLLGKSLEVHRSTIGEYLDANLRGVKYRQESIVERIHVPIFEPLFLELRHFVDCILSGSQPLVSARDGLNALRLAMDIQAAAAAQRLRLLSPTPRPKDLPAGQPKLAVASGD